MKDPKLLRVISTDGLKRKQPSGIKKAKVLLSIMLCILTILMLLHTKGPLI